MVEIARTQYFYLFSGCLFFFATPSLSTTCVVISKDSSLTVGIDSQKYAFRSEKLDSGSVHDKFIVVDDSLYVFHVGIGNFPPTCFDYPRFARASFGKASTYSTEGRIEEFLSGAKGEFDGIVRFVKENPSGIPKSVKNMLNRNHNTVYLALITAVNTRPTPLFFIRQFQYNVARGAYIDTSDITRQCRLIFGNRSQINNYLKTHPLFWEEHDPVFVARKFIEMEIRHDPTSVNYPIHIFRFQGGGAQHIIIKDEGDESFR